MCGVVGTVGKGDVVGAVIDGLKRLEYRGYDSAGLAVLAPDGMRLLKQEGRIAALEASLREQGFCGPLAVGHTRWATHGRPSEDNAHPHQDCSGKIVVVHNGIIENYLEIKQRLMAEGHRFTSETDSEVLAHLIEEHYSGNLEQAVIAGLGQVEGAYALVALHADQPDVLVGAKKDSPLIVGLGDDTRFLASDVPAFLAHTREVIFLEDGDVARLDGNGVRLWHEGQPVERDTHTIHWDSLQAEKGGYKHFLLKEIFEQPRVIGDVLLGRLHEEEGDVAFEDFAIDDDRLRVIERIHLVACGTSWHACLVGKFYLEQTLRIPVDVDIASEFRYRDPVVDEKSLVVLISQSGETADTIAAMREAQNRGGLTLGICNVMGSAIARGADQVIYTHAGPEISVASTKAFTSQLLTLYLLTLFLGRRRGALDVAETQRRIRALRRLRNQMETVLERAETLRDWARQLAGARDFLYLGRGPLYPIALEGALKLKEISYIHAEGYPAGEMKHGPIALIEEGLPVLLLAPRSRGYRKVLANLEEVAARGGRVLAVVSEDETDLQGHTDLIVGIPQVEEDLLPVLAVVPLQLLAYYIADWKGCDVDQPRNLAKSVTVE